MWDKKHKVWKKYLQNDLLAIDSGEAIFLSAYLLQVRRLRIDVSATEVIDLQHYKLLRKPKKVKSALREKNHEPFVFFSILN